jgi:UDP-3-O-[3-hydroxymyristoyl] N-acetylglucosamine deacetylase/3-hydroxyacyl-[acyl-carrier-protein] dehydratase
MSTSVTPAIYERDIAPARTFVYYEDVQSLMEKNLIKGGSLENAIVVRGESVLSKEPLRFPDEFVRHKIPRYHRGPCSFRPCHPGPRRRD